MKHLLVFILILCVAVFVMAQEEPEEVVEPVVPELVEPVVLPVTRLSITLIDEVSDQVIKLENAVIQIMGELHIAEDSFNYSNTFVEGDRYTMTIWIKAKK